MKKILIFSLAYYPHVGGAEVAIKEITERITDIEFHMITMRFSPQDAPHERVGRVSVHRVGKGYGYLSKMLFIPRAAFAARRLHRRERFNGAWAMMSYMLLPIVFANLKIPYALTLQEGDSEAHMFSRLRILPFLPWINSGFRKAKVVQAISTYLGGWAYARGFEGPLEIIPNGVDVKKFSGEKIKHEGTLLLHTGRLVHKNALDVVLRVLPLLPDIRLRLVGDGVEKSALEDLANTLGVRNRVDFLPYVDHNSMQVFLRDADIFIRPSRSEGMGNSFVEAFAAGLPVIATQEGGLRDFITPEVAWVVEKERHDQIALQIKAILSNPAHTAQVVERAKQLAQKYDWSLVATAMREKIFARLFSND